MRLILHPYRARAPERTCARVCVFGQMSVRRAFGLTESPGGVNGIRLTCVIQLGCGREVCPHPSAGGDKAWRRGGKGLGDNFIILLGILQNFSFNQFVCLDRSLLGLWECWGFLEWNPTQMGPLDIRVLQSWRNGLLQVLLSCYFNGM